MNLKVTKALSKTLKIEIDFTDERDLKEALLKATPFMQIPYKCGLCESERITLQAKTDSNNEYIFPQMYCFECGATKPMGERKSPKGALFWKKWEPKFEGIKNGN